MSGPQSGAEMNYPGDTIRAGHTVHRPLAKTTSIPFDETIKILNVVTGASGDLQLVAKHQLICSLLEAPEQSPRARPQD